MGQRAELSQASHLLSNASHTSIKVFVPPSAAYKSLLSYEELHEV
jgi:hypothetical protein